MVAWAGSSAQPAIPAGYSKSRVVGFGNGMTATWDANNSLIWKQQTSEPLFIFAHCSNGRRC
jgi:hypothetical protein